jgi:hypothetical protein
VENDERRWIKNLWIDRVKLTFKRVTSDLTSDLTSFTFPFRGIIHKDKLFKAAVVIEQTEFRPRKEANH